jgi:hypothetical protein
VNQYWEINGVYGEYAARQALGDVLVPVTAVGSLQLNNNLSALYRNWALQDMPSSMAAGAMPCSFSADTLVATADGEQPIVTLRIGNVVLAYNEGLGQTGWYTVTGVWVHDDPIIEYVTIDGERIETTPEHPFFTEEDGWLPASELRFGMHVRNADGRYGTVQTIQFAFRTQPMYNLTVEGAHTFFVGDKQWLVHNAPCGGSFAERNIRTSDKFWDRLKGNRITVRVHNIANSIISKKAHDIANTFLTTVR